MAWIRLSTPQTPDFIKAYDMDHALDGEILLAFEMNGEPLPMLNGFPLRLVVPGYFGTYWMKHVHELTVIGETYQGFYMSAAYRIPATPGNCIEPGTTPKSMIPIQKFRIRSFLTSLLEGAKVTGGRETLLRGIAFDGGEGLTEVLVSTDGGRRGSRHSSGRTWGNIRSESGPSPGLHQKRVPVRSNAAPLTASAKRSRLRRSGIPQDTFATSSKPQT